MIVRFKASVLCETHWYEYLARFVLGGAMTVAAGLIAARSDQSLAAYFSPFLRSFPPARL